MVGFIEESPAERGIFYNSAAFVTDGRIRHIHRKVYLPTNGMFEEGKFWAAGRSLRARIACAGGLCSRASSTCTRRTSRDIGTRGSSRPRDGPGTMPTRCAIPTKEGKMRIAAVGDLPTLDELGIEYETEDGVWHRELDPGSDRPRTDVEDESGACLWRLAHPSLGRAWVWTRWTRWKLCCASRPASKSRSRTKT